MSIYAILDGMLTKKEVLCDEAVQSNPQITNKELALKLGVCERQVKRYLAKLAKLGYIEITRTRCPVFSGWVNIRKIEATACSTRK